MLFACKKNEDDTRTFLLTGKAQKGPFVLGSTITLNELKPDLNQTGKSFTATISADDGTFQIDQVTLESDIALLTANGYYFNEVSGKLSESTLTLQAIVNLKDRESCNVNVMTHVIKARVTSLVQQGATFEDANSQAKAELLTFLGISDEINANFEDYDIVGTEDYNAILLAFSTMLQKNPDLYCFGGQTAELTQLLASLSLDLADDGKITNKSSTNDLLDNIAKTNVNEVRNNVKKRYSELEKNVTVPDFEKYIGLFQSTHAKNLPTEIIYPDSASFDILLDPNWLGLNILAKSITEHSSGHYTAAATVPSGKTLTIKFSGLNSHYSMICTECGWDVANKTPDGFSLTPNRYNTPISLHLELGPSENAKIEYFENGTETPTYTKELTYIYPEGYLEYLKDIESTK